VRLRWRKRCPGVIGLDWTIGIENQLDIKRY
jgi:hypothetical protein